MSEQVIIRNKCLNNGGETVETKSIFKSTHLVTETQFFAKGTENLKQEKVRFNFYRDIQSVKMSHEADDEGQFDVKIEFMQSVEMPLIGSHSANIIYSFEEYDTAKQFFAELLRRVTVSHARHQA